MSKYIITYNNGFIQEKNLITSNTYKTEVKPRLFLIEKEKLRKEYREKLEADIKRFTGGEYFTDDSPLFKAVKTGILELPKNQGGKTRIKVEKL